MPPKKKEEKQEQPAEQPVEQPVEGVVKVRPIRGAEENIMPIRSATPRSVEELANGITIRRY